MRVMVTHDAAFLLITNVTLWLPAIGVTLELELELELIQSIWHRSQCCGVKWGARVLSDHQRHLVAAGDWGYTGLFPCGRTFCGGV